MPGRASPRRADRRRRHHGQRLCGRGQHRRPPSPRPVRDPHPGGLPEALSRGPRPGPAEGHVQDGHRRDLQLSRRRLLRGARPLAHHGGGIFPRHAVPHLGHRHGGHPAPGAGAAPARLERGLHRAARGRLLPLPARRRGPCLGGGPHPHAAIRRGHGILPDLQALFRGHGEAPAHRHPRPARLQFIGPLDLHRRGRNRSPRSASASTRPACRWARSRPRPMAPSTSP